MRSISHGCVFVSAPLVPDYMRLASHSPPGPGRPRLRDMITGRRHGSVCESELDGDAPPLRMSPRPPLYWWPTDRRLHPPTGGLGRWYRSTSSPCSPHTRSRPHGCGPPVPASPGPSGRDTAMTTSPRCTTRGRPPAGLRDARSATPAADPDQAIAISQIDFTGVYTVREAATLLQVAADTVYEMIHAGAIPHTKVGRQFRIGRFALWAYVNGLSVDRLAGALVSRSTCEHCGLTTAVVRQTELVRRPARRK